VQETVPVDIEIVGCSFLCCVAFAIVDCGCMGCNAVDVNIGEIRCSWQGARLRN
jgi:hypothetical protein